MNKATTELVALTDSDLREQLEATRRELFNVRFRLATRQMANSAALTNAKRKIARILTILRERELQASSSEEQD